MATNKSGGSMSAPVSKISWWSPVGTNWLSRNHCPKNFVVPVLLPLLLQCHCSGSDFNVVLPEICTVTDPGKVNMTWIREMVHLGIRDEQAKLSVNILGPEEICDGSNGFLKFISLTQEDPSCPMIASLDPHLCPTAGILSTRSQRQLISWTCSQGPGVVSLKSSILDVIIAIKKAAIHFNWLSLAFVKYRKDKSPFCEQVALVLQQDLTTSNSDSSSTSSRNNYTVMLLGNLEDLDGSQYAPLQRRLDGLFLCISYNYGFTHNLAQKTETQLKKIQWLEDEMKTQMVLLPEWPLPLEIYAPESPALAIVSDARPISPSFASESLQWEVGPWDESTSNRTNSKLMEPLLAQMILRSVKIGLDLERSQNQNLNSKESESSTTAFMSSTVAPLDSSNSNTNIPPRQHQYTHPYANSNLFEYVYTPSFRFSVVRHENGRWHPLVNLADEVGDKRGESVNSEGKTGERGGVSSSPVKDDSNSNGSTSEFVMTWVQISGAMIVTVALVATVIFISFYTRERLQSQMYSCHHRGGQFSRRSRMQGPYKIILTSHDISFGPQSQASVENNKKISRSLFPECKSGRSPEEKPDLLKGSFGATIKKHISVANMKNDSLILSDTQARYKGDLVHLRQLSDATDFEIKAKAVNVLETLFSLRHENLVAMLGCLTDGSPSLVWEYCSRGSLHDIIKQNDIKLDWAFKLSLLTDLVRGMRYLHSSLVRVHGFLTSKNCVIDARWVLKITDYGIPSINYTQGLTSKVRSNKELLWTAPELLRDENLKKHGTQTGDVYSFAIIMQEILVRGEPYCMLTLSPEEILEKVKKPPPLIRPSVSKGAAPPEAINIMRQCWAEVPDMRPDFIVIHDLFKTLNHGRKANIVDTMFQMLEKYSNNLEEIIRERTEQLDLEKKKTEQLLNRMLPHMVAEKLKLGLPVDPEEFSEVTIYFSDIVGFTTISAYSTPFEVVDLLNDLYTCFDATINDYNVYKVETIGDAYMVVGGAPLWSPDHADQIATMALDLLHQSGKFRIRHLPYTSLRLRIGLHTGSCCAGVVGLTMPRYCLFGDTVNTASRMESTGAPWRIHISSETKLKLEEVGGYIIEYRGVTDIKGKGKRPTYWLQGKEGFNKELPAPPHPSENHGLDEKLIHFGRTGVLPGTESTNSTLSVSSASVKKTAFKDNSGSKEGAHSFDSSLKPGPGYVLVQGELVRCLSPAEHAAHELLNGRPTNRGLRRQFSLDQGSNYYVSAVPKNPGLRKAPSLEETVTDHKIIPRTPSPSFLDVGTPSPATPASNISSVRTKQFSKSQTFDNNDIQLVPTNNTSTTASSGSSNSNSGKGRLSLSPRAVIKAKSQSLSVVEESPNLETIFDSK